jgi:thiosulfate/3-mercaptopyruvate sulfurtransferase
MLSKPLVSAKELAAYLNDPGVVVVDVRWVLGAPGESRKKYEADHIPGAIYLDL